MFQSQGLSELGQLVVFGWHEGWFQKLAALGEPLLSPARVLAEDRGAHDVIGVGGAGRAILDGALRDDPSPLARPAVGDWVALDDAGRIRHVLPRQTQLVRRAAGAVPMPQIVAANVDRVFIVTSANRDFNPRRIDRYLVAIRDGGAEAVVVLNKVDVCDDPAAFVARVPAGVPVISASALAGNGMDEPAAWIPAGVTAALVGSSGVGKSTLVNRLLGDSRQDTGGIRATDDRGRHTTTRREILPLPGGGVVVDTPGMRQLALWLDGDGDGLLAAFSDLADLAASCRFGDCRHEAEPGCAVLAAIDSGTLAADRLASWRKLEREQAFIARQADASLRRAEHDRVRRLHRDARRRERTPKGFR